MSDLTPAASAGAPREWRSIDSAPRDGTLFLGCNLDHPSFGSWPMYRRVRHSVDAADEMVTADLGGWAMVRDLQPDWGELEPVGPEPQVSIAPDDLNRSVRYGWMPRPAPGSPAEKGEGEAYHAKRVSEIMDATGGYWKACSGCQESVEGYVSLRDYPHDKTFRCQPGAGCSECGGLGVIWDNINSDDMARSILSTHPSSDQSDTERMRALVEALTPSGDTKAAYHGEFKFPVSVTHFDDEGEPEEATENVYVPWTTVKEIMAAILARAALAEKEADQCVVVPPKTRYFPADFAPAYQTVAAGALALPADPLPRIITLPGRHADPDAFAVNLSATIGDDAGACGICDVVFITGDRCLTDISLGPVHARCCGPERESYVDLETGDALAADAPIPTPWIWIRNADGTTSLAEVAA